jgi:imidazolonepropionase
MTDESGAKRIIFRGYQLLTLQVDHQPYGWLADAALVTRGPIIEWIGPQRELPAYDGDVQIQEGHGRFLSPGLIDCHTHLVYGGDRSAEWEQRLNGVSYEEIARRGGGILSTVKATREASEDELFASASQRVSAFLKQGVTAIEIKSGYGLNLDTERKMLRVARRIEQHFPVHVSKTLLAAHALPPEYNGRADDYIDHICEGMLPALIGMVDAVDIFCESIAFNPQQMQRVFAAARQLNPQIQLKAHVEQLSNLGGARRAAQMGALSVDHIEYLSATDCAILAEHGTVATLLPGAFYNLKETQKPPVDALRQAGVPIAISSDANPGSSPVASLLLMANMACNLFGLTPEEAIVGLTRNAARALGLDSAMGTLAPGMQANLAIWDIPHPAGLAHGIGHNPCLAVYYQGKRIHQADEA